MPKSDKVKKAFDRVGITSCPKCDKGYTDLANKMSINKANMCLACDHVEGEVLEEKRHDQIDYGLAASDRDYEVNDQNENDKV